jgi:hypothetical protein
MRQNCHLLDSFPNWVKLYYRSLGYHDSESGQISEAHDWDSTDVCSNPGISAIQLPGEQRSSAWTILGMALDIVLAQYG